MIVKDSKQVTCEDCSEEFTIRSYEEMTGWWMDHQCKKYSSRRALLINVVETITSRLKRET